MGNLARNATGLSAGLAAALAALGLAGCGSKSPSSHRTPEQVEADARKKQMEDLARNEPHPPLVAVRLLRSSTKDLKNTVVVAHPEAPLPAGKNALWCATFQLAWDAMVKDVNGARLALGPPAPKYLVEQLDGTHFPTSALDPASFLARAGRIRDGIVPAIRKELKERFDAEMLVSPTVPADGAIAYGFLRKSLPFEHPFEPILRAITFPSAGGSHRVLAFGINHSTTNPDESALRAQVRVLQATPPRLGKPVERFILEFLVRGGKDRLFLAMIPPGATLAATWETVREAAAGRESFLEAGDDVAVPKMNFDLDHRFEEFLGAPIGSGALAGETVAEARQTVRFSLDEGGANLQSHAIIASLGLPHSYLVNRPFLLALIEKGATEPFLLLWLADDELLAKPE